MFVGEAPGQEEDEKGEPFVGGSGRILNALLYHAGLFRKDVYITNIVKCRPPNNRTPEEDEILACKPFLEEEIEKVKPKTIIALGETAATSLTGKDLHPISDWRGLKIGKVLITYHPRYLMQNRNMFQVVVWDLLKAKGEVCIPQSGDEEVEYIIDPPEWPFSFLDPETLVAVDIETTKRKEEEDEERGGGLDPLKDDIIGIAFCVAPGKVYQFGGSYLRYHLSQIQTFLSQHKNFIFHHGLFDKTFIKVKWNIDVSSVWDTLDGMYLIDSSLPKRLNFLRTLYTNFPPYKTEKMYATQLSIVNCKDADVTLRSALMQFPYVKKELMQRMLKEDELAIKMKIRGIKVDKDVLTLHYAQLLPQIETLETQFSQQYGVDISSPKQVSKLLFETLNFPIPISARKGKKQLSVDEEVLTDILRKCVGEFPEKQALNQLLSYRELSKLASTYCEGVYKRIGEDGRVHPDWKPTGTETGRWACKNPNIQNVPKHMRDIFIPEEGKVFFGGDYKSLEVWIAALLAKDEGMLKILKSGKDIHNEVREWIDEVYPLTELYGETQARLRAKAVVFGTFYGRGPKDIAQEFQVSKEIAEKWQMAVLKRFTNLHKHFRETIPKFFEDRGYVETFYGRKRYAERLPQAMNAPVQGTAIDVVWNAAFRLEEEGFHIVINTHDQLVCEEEMDEKRFERFKEIMETSSPELMERFPVEAKIGKNWKEVS